MNLTGISAFTIRDPGGQNTLAIDHLQYGLQSGIITQYQAGRQACIDDPASCGIIINGDNCTTVDFKNYDITIPCLNGVQLPDPIILKFFTNPESASDLNWKLK